MEIDLFKNITENEWDDASVRLIRRLRILYKTDSLPLGNGVEDIVNSAIQDLLSGKRKYHPEYPLYNNLFLICRSNISKLFNLSESKATIPFEDGHDKASNSSYGEFDKYDSDKILSLLKEKVKGDEELELVLLSIYESGTSKPREISLDTGISEARVSELKRKLSRKIGDMLGELL